jgi:nickel-type superoxide dismutase maturation protease
MEPTLGPDDEVLVAPRRAVRVGDVVLARHPFRAGVRIIKRASRCEPDGRWHLVGDNPSESTDSRSLGSFAPDHIIGPITSRF